MKKYIAQVVFYILIVNNVFAQKVKIKGSWTISPSNYNMLAGDDISSTITSSEDQIELSVSGNLNKSTWQISVSKSDINWNNTIEIWVRRTGNGTGSGEVWGGNSYQKIGNMNVTFFEGKRVMSKIPIQLEIRGLTVIIPATSYSTNIVYTLFEY